MTENKRFWLSPIVYDGEQRFVRDKSLIGEKSMSNNEVVDLLNELSDENEQLKKVLGAILLEVRRDISNTNQTGEIKVFINPNSFELISEVLKKYGALKDWYND